VPQLRVGPHLAEHLAAVDLRHLEVEQDDGRLRAGAPGVRAAPEQEVERLLAIVRHVDLVEEIRLLEGGEDELDVVRIVFGEEDGAEVLHGRKGEIKMQNAETAGSDIFSFF